MRDVSVRRSIIFRAGLMVYLFIAASVCHADEANLLKVGIETTEQEGGMRSSEKEIELVKISPGSIPVLGEDSVGVVLPEEDLVMSPEDAAVTAAVADGVSTILAVSAGGIEMNPLISASPAGIVAVTGVKYGLVRFAGSLPEHEKRTTLKASAALWGGAAINNILVFVAAPQPLAIVAGLIMGFWTWNHMESRYRAEDQLIAMRNRVQVSKKAEMPEVLQDESFPN